MGGRGRPYGLLCGVKRIRDQGYSLLKVFLLSLREIISPLTPEFCFSDTALAGHVVTGADLADYFFNSAATNTRRKDLQ
jgi:hypothetical protein